MKLVIGGAFQGKLDFAKKMTGKETGWADGAAVSKEELSVCSGVYDFQELVRRWLLLEEETGTAPEAELEELLQKADLVSLHCPLTEGTHHMINKDTIAMMRDSAILVNTSRGGLIDTDALIEALRARKFGGVGLDVYEDEDDQVFQDFSDDVLENEVVPVLLSFPNVVITSHQAFFTRTALQSIAAITLENARAFARGEELKNEVKA